MLAVKGAIMDDNRVFLRYLDAQPKPVMRPSLLLLIPFLSSMWLYVPNARIVRDLTKSVSGIDSFVFAAAVACLVLSIVLVLYAAKNPHWTGFSRSIGFAASAGYAVLQAVAWTVLLIGGSSDVLFSVLGVLSGMCLMPVIMAWIEQYAMDVRNVMLYGAFSCIGAALFAWGLSFAPPLIAAVLSVACAAVGAFAPIVLAGRDKVAARCAVDAYAADGEGPHEGAQLGSAVRNLLSVIWLPLLGFLVCMFMSSSCEFDLGGTTLRSEFIGGAIASAIAIVLCLVPRKTSFVLLVDKLVVPTLVAVAVVLGGFPAGSSPFYVGASFIFVPMMFLSLFALASLVAIAAAGEFSLPFVFGAAFFSSNFVTIFGLAAGDGLVSSDDIGPVLWVMICAYFGIVIIYLGYASWRQLFHMHGDEGVANGPDRVDAELLEAYRHRRIEQLADEYGLTNRERELLDYLSRGYGSSFIAKNLFISDNTARTHIRNIYRKLGVSAREELLSFFNDQPRASDAAEAGFPSTSSGETAD